MQENMLCPFHYFGITDVSLLGDKEIKSKNAYRIIVQPACW